MSYKRNRFARSWLRSFLYFVFGKCGRYIGRHILPVLLCCLVVALPATVQSFAASEYGSNGINVEDMDWDGKKLIDGNWESLGVDRTHETEANSGYDSYRYVAGQADGTFKNILVYDMQDLHFNHEYKMEFSYKVGYASYTWMFIKLEALGVNNDVVATQLIFVDTPPGNNQWKDVSFKFVPDSTITSGGGYSTVQLSIVFEYTVAYSNPCYITSHIYLNDEDDNTSLLNTILDWLSRIYHSIAGGTDREGVNHEGIVQGVKNGLNSLGTRIGNFFTSLGESLSVWFTDLKNSVVSKIESIQQWFIDLKDNLINGLKSLFIPSDGYFASKKTQLEQFMTDHFGALYQGPSVLVQLLSKLLSLHPVSPSITFPAIKMNWQGDVVQLTDDIVYSFAWLNDSSHPVHYIWTVYRGFATVMLFVAFVNYLKRKYETIFGGGEGAS